MLVNKVGGKTIFLGESSATHCTAPWVLWRVQTYVHEVHGPLEKHDVTVVAQKCGLGLALFIVRAAGGTRAAAWMVLIRVIGFRK